MTSNKKKYGIDGVYQQSDEKINIESVNNREKYEINLLDEEKQELLRKVSQNKPQKLEPKRKLGFSIERGSIKDRITSSSYWLLINTFTNTSGPSQIALLCLLNSLSLGSTVGVVPVVMTDRYARINHGYSLEEDCAYFNRSTKPIECMNGSQDAQDATAIESLISNLFTFLTSAMIGSMSDVHGRKGILVLGTFLALFGPTVLVLIQIYDNMSPFWYYSGKCAAGLVNWLALALSALADCIPNEWRAACFGLLLAGNALGFAFSPLLTLYFSHFQISVVSWLVLVLSMIINTFYFTETLPEDLRKKAIILREQNCKKGQANHDLNRTTFIKQSLLKIKSMIYRPVEEMSILNRDNIFRILSALAFFSGMVTSGDHQLIVYYVEDKLDFKDKDISMMFLCIGGLGIIVQGFLIKPFQDCIGDRYVLVMAFSLGATSNFIYSIAEAKKDIFMGLILAIFARMSFPTISAVKANNASEYEQGRIQGALYSLQSLAYAFGPISMRAVYSMTHHYGDMFKFASFLLCIAVVFSCALPIKNGHDVKNEKRQISDYNSTELTPESSLDASI